MDMELNSIDNSSHPTENYDWENKPMSAGSLSHYRLESSEIFTTSLSRKEQSMSIPSGSGFLSGSRSSKNRYLLWIDGVGTYLVILDDQMTIGGPRHTEEVADLALLSNLSRKHATIIRSSSGNYYLEAHSQVSVSDRDVFENTYLQNGNEILLGNSVKLGFKVPNALSSSAVVSFKSGHRPDQNIDAVILMEDSCLLGPGTENHVTCKEWKETIILFQRDEKIYCQSRADLFIEDKLVENQTEITEGAIVSGVDFRFRLEKI